jgi:hypothetical protein
MLRSFQGVELVSRFVHFCPDFEGGALAVALARGRITAAGRRPVALLAWLVPADAPLREKLSGKPPQTPVSAEKRTQSPPSHGNYIQIVILIARFVNAIL